MLSSYSERVSKRLYDMPKKAGEVVWWPFTQHKLAPEEGVMAEPARDMGYAAARFWHVMFLENVNEPALECAELLLEDAGLLGHIFQIMVLQQIEIALKMVFRKFTFNHGSISDLLNDDSIRRRAQLMVGNVNPYIALD
ncbi:hypothetical protein FEM48_Zijuj06G0111300 [Ziziphus jujuba var. spinosa]|uniref:Uncharacterized protein n=1 Tax=Ziziphus jujuba var. spinosa TaxID=714518 RepID=A0A978V8X7_ZIZJJ|nr:hypothetical protein FEM48_Zijuj06G0111300 [Ziziphus jujuba var. spinosa]